MSSSSSSSQLVSCPVCNRSVPAWYINTHLDQNCSCSQVSPISPVPSPNSQGSSHSPKRVRYTTPTTTTTPTMTTAKDTATEEESNDHDRDDNEGKTLTTPTMPTMMRVAPLAEEARPGTLADFCGQPALVGVDALLRKLIEQDRCPSLIFWGPPGCGKTTLAKIISKVTKRHFVSLSAVNSGVNDVKSVMNEARNRLRLRNQKTILFLDEIHRYSKAQQDVLLPYVEQGVVSLMGATTENPSFSLNSALLSRCRVFLLEKLAAPDVVRILRRALSIKQESIIRGVRVEVSDKTLDHLAAICDGDARTAINALEMAIDSEMPQQGVTGGRCELTDDVIKQALLRAHMLYDRDGEEHYNVISALHKSIRGSDPDAALYWLCRMLEAGDDARFIARRLVVCASEDIGLADPTALLLATATYSACQTIGKPECGINLAHCVTYLANAKKNNTSYAAYKAAQETVRTQPAYPVPLHLRNAPTTLMKNIGYGKDYKYNHDFEGPVAQTYLPEPLQGTKFFGRQAPKKTDPDVAVARLPANPSSN